jgi:two-component system sensor histidine kinase VicK
MQDLLQDPLFQALFNSPVPRIIVKANAPEFTIVISNDAHKAATNLSGKNINGKSVWEIFDPNEAGGNGGELLRNALTSAQLKNKTVLMPPFRYDMSAPDGNGMVEKWWQLEIMPVSGTDNTPKFLLTTTHNITDQVLRERSIEDGKNQLAEINSLLEERVAIRTRELSVSEHKFRTLVEQSPVAIALLTGKDHIIEAANEEMLKLWRKDNSVINKPIKEALPEIEEQEYKQILNKVFATGTGYDTKEAQFVLNNAGGPVVKYMSFSYDPLFDENHKVTAIIVSANDITARVNERTELQRVYEQARLSKLAAQLGTFDMDLIKGTMEWDARCRELFGISHNDDVTFEKDFLPGLHTDDRDRVNTLITKLFDSSQSDGVYDVDYRTIGSEDGKIRWVRAKGKVYFDDQGTPLRFIGSVLDITDKKHEEQLRNDFIGMASHELKTPLTSLSAILQVLQSKLKRNEDNFIPGALQKANIQVKKMSNMINSFLNVSRLESGKMMIEKQPFIIGDLIRETIEENYVMGIAHSIELINCDKVVLSADKEKIGSVLSNLLSNAVKYSPKGTRVLVNCQKIGSQVQVSVEDEGLGIRPEEQSRLFDRYYRVESNRTRNVSGFGIGLYLCSEIIQRHNGNIWIQSQPGKGSSFYFTLPV